MEDDKEYTMVEHDDANNNNNDVEVISNVETNESNNIENDGIVSVDANVSDNNDNNNQGVDVDAVIQESVDANSVSLASQNRRVSMSASIDNTANNNRRDSVKSQLSASPNVIQDRRRSSVAPALIPSQTETLRRESIKPPAETTTERRESIQQQRRESTANGTRATTGSISIATAAQSDEAIVEAEIADVVVPVAIVDAVDVDSALQSSTTGARRPTSTSITEREARAFQATSQLASTKKNIDKKHFVANGQQLTLKRKQEREWENLLLKQHFSTWITELTDIPINYETFCDDLYDGVALCRMLAKVVDVPKFADPVDRKKMFGKFI